MIPAVVLATVLIAPQPVILAWVCRKLRRPAQPVTSAERRRLLLEDAERERDAVEAVFARGVRAVHIAAGGGR